MLSIQYILLHRKKYISIRSSNQFSDQVNRSQMINLEVIQWSTRFRCIRLPCSHPHLSKPIDFLFSYRQFSLSSNLSTIVVKPGLKIDPVKGPGPEFYGSTRVNLDQPINPDYLGIGSG